ncbi:type IV pilin accessory protein [Acinetobacter sp. Tr-809]|uniref:TfpX/TfpZ family type IV pilin accessory protein n=1 Tax=Acinetobacter sp. Tr-809 TaxID=2608324 RepID=UPI001421BD8A|nr:TfpX/TfpZ family type IV pilin accessory protein [Acinetobacter sp. Tr-809]NIE96572.1 type IV pilin accessory protein [Acinetobacter sp. Tr-809]
MLDRKRFFLIHLLFCLVCLFVLFLVVVYIWYPSHLAKAAGVMHVFIIIMILDVIVGPCLGGVIYKNDLKKSICDIFIIIIIQISFLFYGAYIIFQGRPSWLVYNVDRFELVRNNEILKEHIAQASLEYKEPSWLNPQFVGVEFSKDKNIRGDEMFAEVLGGISIAQKPERYVPLDKVKSQIQQRAQSLDVLNQFNDKALVQKIFSQYPQATAFVPLKANAVDMTVLINKEKGEVVKIVDLRPWK